MVLVKTTNVCVRRGIMASFVRREVVFTIKIGCINKCSGHGKCSPDYECICQKNWYGKDCSSQNCPNDCSNAGICIKGKCLCVKGRTGADCSNAVCLVTKNYYSYY
jgi:hypothetical protein